MENTKIEIMKSVFITFDISHKEAVIDLLTHNNCRGFSFFDQMQGRGSVSGDPHYGTHGQPLFSASTAQTIQKPKHLPMRTAYPSARLG